MAGYQDNIQALTNFNPYVQQLPVEAMREVGMYKQQQYNEGIQKIQTNIDNIAGLDVIRGVDRQYLQSKLNEVGNNLKFVAAGDFSDFQLVNSASGMVNQIAKDRTVQSSVSNSAMYRKEIARIDKDREAGKENPNNTSYFNKRASAWLEGQRPGESLNEKYFTPIDVWGKITAIAKEVGVDSVTAEEMFVTDSNGQRLMKDGKPILNKVTLQKKLKGKDPAKLLDAFERGLTTADYKQLSIDGIGNYAHMTPEDLKVSISETSRVQLNDINQRLDEIGLALISENSRPKKNLDVIASLEKQQDFFGNQASKLTESRDRSLETADNNPDAVRGALYTNSYITGMSRDLANVEKEEHFTENVLYKQNVEDNKFAHQLQQDAFNRQMAGANYNLNVEKFKEEVKNKNLDRTDKLTEWYLKYGYGTPPPGTATGTKMPIPVPEGGINYTAAVEDDYQQTLDEKNTTELEIALAYIDKMATQNPGKTPVERREYNLKVINQSSGPGKGITREDYIRKTATYQQQRWNTNKETVPREFREKHMQYNNLTKDVQAQKEKIQEVDKLARTKLQQQGLSIPSDAEIKKLVKGQDFMVGGKRIPVTPDDMIQIVHSRPDMFNVFGKYSVDAEQERKKEIATKYLTNKFGTSLQPILKAIYPTIEGQQVATYGTQDVRKLLYNKNLDKFNNIKNDIYKGKLDIPMGQSIPIQRGKENFADVGRRVKTALSNYINSDGTVLGTQYTAAEVYDALLNEQGNIQFNVKPKIGRSNKTDIDLLIANKSGGTFTIPVNSDVYKAIKGGNPPEKVATQQINDKLRWAGSTNSSGNYKLSYWKDHDFSNFKHDNLTINADLVSVVGNPALATLKIYLFDKKSGKHIDTVDYPQDIPIKDEYGNDVDLNSLPAQLNPSVLNQIIK